MNNETKTTQGAPAPQGGTADNLRLYEALRAVPAEARKPISDGRLKGKTDVNGMWRIKRLTEVFGPCGFGWKYTVRDQRILDADNGNAAAFVDIDLYVKDPATGQWSEPIPGIGGNVFKRVERSGATFMDDDCFKKALTDALSIAAKALGLAADVWYERDTTSKYQTEAPVTAQAPAAGEGVQQRNRPAQTAPKPALTPASRQWNASVARAAATSDGPARIRQRIEQAFTVSDEDFGLLMRQAGKALDGAQAQAQQQGGEAWDTW